MSKTSFVPALNLALLGVPAVYLELKPPTASAVLCPNASKYSHSPRLEFFVYGTPLVNCPDGSLVDLTLGTVSVLATVKDWVSPKDQAGMLLVSPDVFRFLTRNEPTPRLIIENVGYRLLQIPALI